ncbi:MAG: hypothetical protein R2761_16390 [Acidimicrobiales bacterium]
MTTAPTWARASRVVGAARGWRPAVEARPRATLPSSGRFDGPVPPGRPAIGGAA